jgi:hypothetical protein
MENKTELLIKRIDELLATRPTNNFDGTAVSKVYLGTLSLATSLYGLNSPQVQSIEKRNADFSKAVPDRREQYLINELYGMLRNIREEIQSGLITSLQAEAKGEVLADFVVMAKRALENDSKDVAAVLACAALEDTLKRYAELEGLNVYDKEMSDVIGALKSKGLIKGPRGKILESFTTVRNKAFHAQWDRIDTAEVHSIIAFVQEFLVSEFSNAIP